MVINSRKKAGFIKGGYQRYRPTYNFSGNKIRQPKKAISIPKNFWKFVILLLFAGALVYWLLFSNYFKISDAFVEGTKLVDPVLIKNDLPYGQNIFFMNEKTIRNRILGDFPEIKSLEIYRGIPNALKVVILEGDGKIVWQTAGVNYLLSSQGEVMRRVDDLGQFADLPVVVDSSNIPVEPGRQIVSPNFIAFLLNINANFFEETNIKPKNFEILSTTFDVNLYTEADFYVKLNSLRSSKKQLENLKIVLSQKRQDVHEYIDLRIDGWAYYK